MKKDTHETKVVFRVFKDKGDVLALFPYEDEGNGLCMSYQRIGQHSSASYEHCIEVTRRATIDEYTPLKNELERIGYNLAVRQKRGNRK